MEGMNDDARFKNKVISWADNFRGAMSGKNPGNAEVCVY